MCVCVCVCVCVRACVCVFMHTQIVLNLKLGYLLNICKAFSDRHFNFSMLNCK